MTVVTVVTCHSLLGHPAATALHIISAKPARLIRKFNNLKFRPLFIVKNVLQWSQLRLVVLPKGLIIISVCLRLKQHLNFIFSCFCRCPMITADWLLMLALLTSLCVCLYIFDPLGWLSPRPFPAGCSKHVDTFMFLFLSDHYAGLAPKSWFKTINMRFFPIWIGSSLWHGHNVPSWNEAQSGNSGKWQISLFEGQPEKVALPDFVRLLMRHFFSVC